MHARYEKPCKTHVFLQFLEEPQRGSVPFDSSFLGAFGVGRWSLLHWGFGPFRSLICTFFVTCIGFRASSQTMFSKCRFWVPFLARRGGLWAAFWSPFETSDWGAYPPNFIFEAVSLAKSSLNGHIWCWRVLWGAFCIDFGSFCSARDDHC